MEHLPPELQTFVGGLLAVDQDDKRSQIVAALAQCQGNRAAAARLLGISRATLYRRFVDLELDPESY